MAPLNTRKNNSQQQHLDLITERYQLAYNTIYNQYEQLARNLQKGMMARFNVQDIYTQLLVADEAQKNILRQELLAQTKHRFKEMKEEGLVEYIHFHLPDNESFLRLHRPDKFLDGSVKFLSLVHADDRQRIADDVKQFSDSGASGYTHEPYRLITRSGSLMWVHDSTTVVRNAQGEIVKYQGYLVDITKMVLMEKEVAKTKTRLKQTQKEEQLKRLESLKTMAGAIAHRFY